MRKLLFAICLLSNAFISAQNDNRIKFEYDSAGNQTRRYVCLCGARTANDSITKTDKTITDVDMIQDSDYEQLSYYPNPVLNELYVKWNNTTKNPIVEIQLFSMSGQLLNTQKNLAKSELNTVNFQNYPTGIYHLILICSNGERKTLKIIKE
ncbi:T9SS type A sorting domain-containing protein [Flavobacterium sp.]|uniref:T9SS type A sorting domain-containing protein n=1 Tax=Flavobacterium sp. TaxID=239 RepID=UPI002634858E|nr:T9SS type A sorting domain-containing protein [Flavobacterium sp.]